MLRLSNVLALPLELAQATGTVILFITLWKKNVKFLLTYFFAKANVTESQLWALKRRKHCFILKATILYEKSNGLFTFSKVGSVNFIVSTIFSKLSPLILS
jgi:hypothetical protein